MESVLVEIHSPELNNIFKSLLEDDEKILYADCEKIFTKGYWSSKRYFNVIYLKKFPLCCDIMEYNRLYFKQFGIYLSANIICNYVTFMSAYSYDDKTLDLFSELNNIFKTIKEAEEHFINYIKVKNKQ